MQQVNKPKKPMMFYYMVVLVILFLLNFLLFPQLLKPDVKEVDYGTFLSMVDKKEVSKVQIEDDMIYFQDKEETPNYYETAAFEDPDLVERLYDAGCSFDRVVQKEMSPLLSFLLTWILPILIFAGLGELLGRSMMKRMGGGSGAMQFGKSNAKIYVQSITPVRPEVCQKSGHEGLNRDRLCQINNELAAIALEKNCYFLNLWEVLADENGDLIESYAQPDGYHLRPAGYAVWTDYLCSHTEG